MDVLCTLKLNETERGYCCTVLGFSEFMQDLLLVEAANGR
jgi:hypothetical protein